MEQLKDFVRRLTESNFNNEIGRNLPKMFAEEAKEKGIVIVYGASDDLMEFDGAIYDEVGCYEGGVAYLTFDDGVLLQGCDCVECNKKRQAAKKIEAFWCSKDSEWTWSYKTDIPYETFEMYDEDEKYCLGLVFYKDSLKVQK